jgi:branched-chain amino acid transport system permease protein
MSDFMDSIRDRWAKLPYWFRRIVLPLAFLALLILYPEWLPAGSSYVPSMATMVNMAVFATMALGLNVVVGYCGLLDLGYVAFYAAGAYVAGWFATLQFAPHSVHIAPVAVLPVLPGIHVSVWLLLLVAGLFALSIGVVIGLPTLRLRGDYLAIVTLGFGEIIPQAVNNGDNWFGHNITNGPNGLTPIDSLGFGNSVHGWFSVLPANYRVEVDVQNYYYWTGLAMLGFTLFCCIRLRDSRLGRAWIAIREDEIAAAAMGIALMRVKTLSYAIGAFFGGVAGCFFAIYKSSTFPGDFNLQISIFVLCMVILGGMGNVWGVMLGGAVLAYLNYQGLAAVGNSAGLDVSKYSFMIFGAIIVVMMLVRPEGLLPESRRKAEFEDAIENDPEVVAT